MLSKFVAKDSGHTLTCTNAAGNVENFSLGYVACSILPGFILFWSVSFVVEFAEPSVYTCFSLYTSA